jgi:putative xylitol transport system ATP-binding protein
MAREAEVTPLLEVKGLAKSFGGVAALRDGRFRLEGGSVHALCGGNGAGKSTFLSIIMGIHKRDAGQIWRNGKLVEFASPAAALGSGISIIEQELSPIPHMTVAENIHLGREPSGRFGGIDFGAMNKAASRLLDTLEFDISPTRLMMDLSIAQTQLVEIAKALSYDAEVIFMDEPTSAIGAQEVEQLFKAIGKLKAQGKGVVYVSHRLSEIFDVADSYTVLRDGAYVDGGSLESINRRDLIRLIVGRDLEEEFTKTNLPTEQSGLVVKGLSDVNKIRDVSFSANKGEILGIYGLMGSGRTEIFECLFGLNKKTAGTVKVGKKEVSLTSPSEAISHGLALVTEDRKLSGLVMTGSVRENLCLASLPDLGRAMMMYPSREKTASKEVMDQFSIKADRDTMSVSDLSGGNQQKVVLGKWFMTKPDVLLLDEPTRGVDVGAKREIYAVMSDFATQGGTVVMISSEIEEVLGMADRILVMRDGRIAGVLAGKEAHAEALVNLAA